MSKLTVDRWHFALASYSDDDAPHLPGDLTFHRIKQWGNEGTILEVAEAQANFTLGFETKNSYVKCVFIKSYQIRDQMVASPFPVST